MAESRPPGVEPGWSVLLDLGRDVTRTEFDALSVEAALRDVGIESLFYPWHPTADVLTPLGAQRPLLLLVRDADASDAREVVNDVLPQPSGVRWDVTVPVADAWVLPYYVGIVVRHLRTRRLEGGAWAVLYWAFWLFTVVALVAWAVGVTYTVATMLLGLLGR
jgi:hypothetical protein